MKNAYKYEYVSINVWIHFLYLAAGGIPFGNYSTLVSEGEMVGAQLGILRGGGRNFIIERMRQYMALVQV